jgi:hypothetical protein
MSDAEMSDDDEDELAGQMELSWYPRLFLPRNIRRTVVERIDLRDF